jgi:hypothetical protein
MLTSYPIEISRSCAKGQRTLPRRDQVLQCEDSRTLVTAGLIS